LHAKNGKNNNSKVLGIIFFWKRYLIAPKKNTEASWLEKEQQ
jgi:hypothetical protein